MCEAKPHSRVMKKLTVGLCYVGARVKAIQRTNLNSTATNFGMVYEGHS